MKILDSNTREHIYLTFVFCLIGFLSGNIWFGYGLICFGFFMREVTQFEYRWIEDNGGLRKNFKFKNYFDFKYWDYHSLEGFLAPALFGILFNLSVINIFKLINK